MSFMFIVDILGFLFGLVVLIIEGWLFELFLVEVCWVIFFGFSCLVFIGLFDIFIFELLVFIFWFLVVDVLVILIGLELLLELKSGGINLFWIVWVVRDFIRLGRFFMRSFVFWNFFLVFICLGFLVVNFFVY